MVDIEEARRISEAYAHRSDERGILSGWIEKLCDEVERLQKLFANEREELRIKAGLPPLAELEEDGTTPSR